MPRPEPLTVEWFKDLTAALQSEFDRVVREGLSSPSVQEKPLAPALILGDQILQLIRAAGVSKLEAYAALDVVKDILPSVSDISFRNDRDD